MTPTPHRRTPEDLSAWLDGELTEAEQRELEAELARDPALRADLEALEGVVRLVREEAPTVAPPGFEQRILLRVAELEPEVPAPGSFFGRWFGRWEGLLLVGVAAAVLLLVVPVSLRPSTAEAPPDAGEGTPSPGAGRLPPRVTDPAEGAAPTGSLGSPSVPAPQVIGRASVEPSIPPSRPEFATPIENGTNLRWEDGAAPTVPAVEVEGTVGQEVDGDPAPPPAAPDALRYTVRSDDPSLKRRVMSLSSRYGEVTDAAGHAVSSADRDGTETLLVRVAQADLPALSRGLVSLGFDVTQAPAELLAGDEVVLRLVLEGAGAARPQAAPPTAAPLLDDVAPVAR